MDSLDKLLALINASNELPRAITREMVTFSNIAPLAGDPEHNTNGTMTGVPGQGYSGSITLSWRRIDLASIIDGTGLLADENLTAQDVIDRVNTNWETWLTLEDLEPFDPPDTTDGEFHDLVLIAKEDSLGWIGTVTLTLAQPSMSVFDTTLNVTMPQVFSGLS